MSIDSDLHNFGRSVQKLGRGYGVFFQKPRPIYWEWLLFGKNSPLAGYFEIDRKPFNPRHAIFNLETEMGSDFCGFSREVLTSEKEAIGLSHYYSLGVLLAYCYVFGVRDLHRHNVIRTSTHLQVVDAEVVFVQILLPNETLLLPFKDVDLQLSAAGLLQSAIPDGLSPEARKEILIGYHDTFNCFIKNRAKILSEIERLSDQTNRVPIRHILRDTIRYRSWKTVQPEEPFFDSELEQLARGDIPYFFKFLGDTNLYAYFNSKGDFNSITIPANFQKATDRVATSPRDLLSETRISDTLMPTGFLFLAARLFPRSYQGHINLGEIALHFDLDRITLQIEQLTFESKR